jgi:hypothetical protein
MMKARLALLGAATGAAVAVATLAGACDIGAPPPNTVPPSADQVPPPPTAAVGANGQPITSLCDLLSEEDFNRILSVTAKAPTANDATMTSADCVYGKNILLTIRIGPDLASAQSTYDSMTKALQSPKKGPIGGVDASVYGKGSDSVALGLRRQKMVVTITAPGVPADGEIKLVQLAGLVLSRANALGT